MEMIIRQVAAAMAVSKLPIDIFKNRATGKVSVTILVAPATIRAQPNSPIARDQLITKPPIMPFLAKGKVIL